MPDETPEFFRPIHTGYYEIRRSPGWRAPELEPPKQPASTLWSTVAAVIWWTAMLGGAFAWIVALARGAPIH